MATTDEQTYSHIFIELNQHLHNRQPIKATFPIQDIYPVQFNEPKFLGSTDYINYIKLALKVDFGFNNNYFNKHTANYCAHQIIEQSLNEEQNDKLINVHYLYGHGFYHYLTEVLPNLIEINKPHDVYVKYCRFAESVARWFDISNNIIFDVDKNKYKLEITQPVIECGTPSPRKIQLLRSVAERKLTFSPSIGILIFRRETLRRILNIKATFEMVKELFPNMEWVIFDTMPIEKATELFSTAKVIFAPHGAGLTNTIFCPTGTLIYELMPMEKPNLCYYHISEILGHKHYIIPHETKENQQFAVNTARVSALIKESLNNGV